MILDSKFIGERVKIIRKSVNESQELFAENINTSSRTISNIENGTVVPTLQTVVNIAEYANCTIESIILKEE